MIKNKKLFFGILGVSIFIIIGAWLLMHISKPIIGDIEDVKARHEASLMNVQGVVGVGIGECDKQPCIKVYLDEETAESKNIPSQLEGFRVDVELTSPIEALGEVKIQTDIDTYTPTLDITVGIGLTPIYTSLGRNPETVKFSWHTNYGEFISWAPPDYKVNELGSEAINNGEKIYWSYSSEDMGVNKPPVRISLNVKDAKSGQVLAESVLEIEWENQDVAKVKR